MQLSEKEEKNISQEFIKSFRHWCKNHYVEATEISDKKIMEIISNYLSIGKLTDANKYLYDAIDEYMPEISSDNIDWGLELSELKKTPVYIAWERNKDIRSCWQYYAKRDSRLEEKWVKVNGKVYTDEEAATKAADKWCELIFNWHLQDNGALNEDHGGGFYACALGTVIADNARKNITEEMENKAHQLFKEYYLHELHFYSNHNDRVDSDWLEKALPDKGKEFDWGGCFYDLSCDYGPNWALYLILFHAGIPEKSIDNICPWKTSIHIRKVDNTVVYRKYQHYEEL